MNDQSPHAAPAKTQLAVDADRASGAAGAITLASMAIFALLGIFVMAQAVDGVFQLFGACLTLFSIFMLFRVIALLLPHHSSDI